MTEFLNAHNTLCMGKFGVVSVMDPFQYTQHLFDTGFGLYWPLAFFVILLVGCGVASIKGLRYSRRLGFMVACFMSIFLLLIPFYFVSEGLNYEKTLSSIETVRPQKIVGKQDADPLQSFFAPDSMHNVYLSYVNHGQLKTTDVVNIEKVSVGRPKIVVRRYKFKVKNKFYSLPNSMLTVPRPDVEVSLPASQISKFKLGE